MSDRLGPGKFSWWSDGRISRGTWHPGDGREIVIHVGAVSDPRDEAATEGSQSRKFWKEHGTRWRWRVDIRWSLETDVQMDATLSGTASDRKQAKSDGEAAVPRLLRMIEAYQDDWGLA
jgi:hypothetical protein